MRPDAPSILESFTFVSVFNFVLKGRSQESFSSGLSLQAFLSHLAIQSPTYYGSARGRAGEVSKTSFLERREKALTGLFASFCDVNSPI